MTEINIAARFSRNAETYPTQAALICTDVSRPARQYSYRYLDDTSTAIAKGLRKAGLNKGDRVVLMVLPGLDFFALAFALFKLGAVLVGIDPGMGLRNLGRCLAEAQPAAFIGNRKAHLARRLLRWSSLSLRLHITTETIPFQGDILNLARLLEWGIATRATLAIATRADDMAAILFTSGSTGAPKGVVYSHGNFTAQVAALQQTFDIQPGEIDLATFPLFALYAPVMGMTSVIPAMDFTRPGSVDLRQIHHAISMCKPTSMFGSPALLNRVGKWGVANNIILPSLRRVLSAGAPVAPAVLERFVKLLAPGAQVHTPYGATEALPVSSIGSNEVLNETGKLTAQGRGICVGQGVDGIEIRIIPITDEPIAEWRDELAQPPNEIGEIVVRGPQVTCSYYNREESTRLTKIAAGNHGCYHRMGDLGYLDEHGRLWFCGRKSQRIDTVLGTLYTIPCEGVFNTHPRVSRTALVGVPADRGYLPVLCVEPEAGVRKSEYPAIRSELLNLGGKHEHTTAIKHILFHKDFPVDVRHNAKINRERLALWAQRKLR